MLSVLFWLIQFLGALIVLALLAVAAFVIITLVIEGLIDAIALWKERSK